MQLLYLQEVSLPFGYITFELVLTIAKSRPMGAWVEIINITVLENKS